MALITLAEAKEYLKVDSSDEENLINSLFLPSACKLCADVGRLTDEQWAQVDAEPTDEDGAELKTLRAIMKVAVMYTVGYLSEHREKADHHDLDMTLRGLLFAVREGVY